MLIVKPIAALKDNYIWAIIDPINKNALIIDPGDAAPVHTFLEREQLTLKAILITHHHWDHSNGAPTLSEQYQAPIYSSANNNLEADIAFADIALKAIPIPGHTLDHVAFYSPGILFCGDTLFAAGCGRIFEGTAPQMYQSLQTIAALPETTKIYCGHEYTLANLHFAALVEPSNEAIATRIKKVTELRAQHLPTLPTLLSTEKATNPFLRCQQTDVISSVENYAGKTLSNEIEVFACLRQWKSEPRTQ